MVYKGNFIEMDDSGVPLLYKLYIYNLYNIYNIYICYIYIYVVLRHYPKGLGIALVNIFKNLGPQADLRGKPDLPMEASERELFEAEPLGDPWWDAELPDVFFYLLKNKRLRIPESWKQTMMDFKAELEAAPGF